MVTFFVLQEKVKGGQSVQNKEKRFRETVSSLPGPGAYDLQLGLDLEERKKTSSKPGKVNISLLYELYDVDLSKEWNMKDQCVNPDILPWNMGQLTYSVKGSSHPKSQIHV